MTLDDIPEAWKMSPCEFLLMVESHGIPVDRSLLRSLMRSSIYRSLILGLLSETDVLDDMFKDPELMNILIRKYMSDVSVGTKYLRPLLARRPGIPLAFYVGHLESMMIGGKWLFNLGYANFESAVYGYAERYGSHPDFPKGLLERIAEIHFRITSATAMCG